MYNAPLKFGTYVIGLGCLYQEPVLATFTAYGSKQQTYD